MKKATTQYVPGHQAQLLYAQQVSNRADITS